MGPLDTKIRPNIIKIIFNSLRIVNNFKFRKLKIYIKVHFSHKLKFSQKPVINLRIRVPEELSCIPPGTSKQ